MAWLEEIKTAVADGIIASLNEIKDTFTIFMTDFLKNTMTGICDILCVCVLGYIVYVCIRTMMGDTKMYGKLFDKTFFSLIFYMILRACQIVYFKVGGGLLG